MLAKPVEVLPRPGALPGGCLYEPKWDGYRALVRVDEDGARIRSRHGVDLTGAFPDIARAAAGQLHPGSLLDGELVIWNAATSALDFPALQRRLASPARAARLAAAEPASFVAFDILVDGGVVLTGQRLRERRRALERLVPLLSPPLQVTPATADHDVAAAWLRDYTTADVGVEGLVIKALGQPYRPGVRAWLKLRSRTTAEAVVGAITGTLARPDRLVLGLHDRAGRLRVAGTTAPLSPDQRRDLRPHLRPPAGEHPWPAVLPPGMVGPFDRERRLPVVRVEPSLVVEIHADQAFEHGRWRHVTRLARVRADLGAEKPTTGQRRTRSGPASRAD